MNDGSKTFYKEQKFLNNENFVIKEIKSNNINITTPIENNQSLMHN